jgi:hypothetical protein
MNMEKGKRGLMVLARKADTAMNGHSPEDEADAGMAQKNGGPKLDRGTQSRIGDQLRAMYNDLMDQPVPDKLKALLEQLENRDEGNRR